MKCRVSRNVTQEELAEMKEVLGNITPNVLLYNNGFHVQYTKDGVKSILFEDLKNRFGRDKAIQLKAMMYAIGYDIEPSMQELLADIESISSKKIKVSSDNSIISVIKDRILLELKGIPNSKIISSNEIEIENSFEEIIPIVTKLNKEYGSNTVRIKTNKDGKIVLSVVINSDIVDRMKESNMIEKQDTKVFSRRSESDLGKPSRLTDFDNQMFKNFSRLIEVRKKIMSKLISDLKTLENKLRHTPDKKLVKKITDLHNQIDDLQIQISILTKQKKVKVNSPIVIIRELADLDFRRLNTLINSNNPLDIEEAEMIIEFLRGITAFGNKNPLLFGIENYSFSVEDNNILARISRLIDAYEENLKIKMMNIAMKELKDHPMYEKLLKNGENLSIGELMKNKKDIDIFTKLFLSVDFDFSGNDSILSQLIMFIFRKVLIPKELYVRDIIEKINSLEPTIKKILKNSSIGEIFYAHNKKGVRTPFLISVLSVEWKFFKDSVIEKYQNDILKAYKIENKEQRSRAINAAHRKKFNTLNRVVNFINPMEHLSLLNDDDLIDIIKLENEFSPLKTKSESSVKFLNAYGDTQYNETIQEQKTLILEWNEALKSKIFDIKKSLFDNGKLNENDDLYSTLLIYLKRNPEVWNELKLFYFTNSPFVEKTSDGYISEYPKLSSSYKYNTFLPKTNQDIYFDDTYKKIFSEESDTYSEAETAKLREFLLLLRDAAAYINAIADSPGKKLLRDSILSFNASAIETIAKLNSKGLRQGFISLAKLTKDNINKQITSPYSSKNIQEIVPYMIKTPKRASAHKFQSISQQAKEKALLLAMAIADNTQKIYDKESVTMDHIIKSDIVAQYFGITSSSIEKYVRDNVYNPENLSGIEILYYLIVKNDIEQQSMDLTKTLKYFLKEAAYLDARNEITPTLTILKKIYNEIKDLDGNERDRAIKRMEGWFTRVVLDEGVTEGIPLEKTNIKSEKDKENIEVYNKLEKYLSKRSKASKEFKKLQNSVTKSGKPVNLGFLGLLYIKFQILKSLAFSPVSGYFNKVNGYIANKLLDTMGYAWTPGNIVKANAFLSRRSIKELIDILGQGKTIGKLSKKYTEFRKVQLLIYRLGIITDVRNERQKAGTSPDRDTFQDVVDPLYLAITRQEWKIQTAAILSVLMDYTIKDKNGNEYKIFDGDQLIPFEIVEDRLVLKKEFRTQENIDTWEKMNSKNIIGFINLASTAIRVGQGDFLNIGGMLAKHSIFGKIMMLFYTFAASYMYMRLGKQTNLNTGKIQKHSVYQYASRPAIGGIAGVTTMAVLFGLGSPAMIGAAFGLGSLAGVLIRKQVKDEELELKSLAEEASLLLTALVTMTSNIIGFPLNFMIKKIHSITGIKNIKGDYVNVNVEKMQKMLSKEKMNPNESKAITFVLYEMTLVITMMLAKALTILALRDEECSKEQKYINPVDCNKRHLKNNIANYLNNSYFRIMSDILTFLPGSISSHFTNGTFLRVINDMSKLVYYLANPDIDTIKSGENIGESRVDRQISRLLLPSIISSTKHGFNVDYTDKSLAGGMGWISRAMKSDFDKFKNEYESEKAKFKKLLINEGYDDDFISKAVSENYNLKLDSKKISKEDFNYIISNIDIENYRAKKIFNDYYKK